MTFRGVELVTTSSDAGPQTRVAEVSHIAQRGTSTRVVGTAGGADRLVVGQDDAVQSQGTARVQDATPIAARPPPRCCRRAAQGRSRGDRGDRPEDRALTIHADSAGDGRPNPPDVPVVGGSAISRTYRGRHFGPMSACASTHAANPSGSNVASTISEAMKAQNRPAPLSATCNC